MWKTVFSVAVAVAQASPQVNSAWQSIGGRHPDDSRCLDGINIMELRTDTSACEKHAVELGYEAFTIDNIGQCCFWDGSPQHMIPGLIDGEFFLFYYLSPTPAHHCQHPEDTCYHPGWADPCYITTKSACESGGGYWVGQGQDEVDGYDERALQIGAAVAVAQASEVNADWQTIGGKKYPDDSCPDEMNIRDLRTDVSACERQAVAKGYKAFTLYYAMQCCFWDGSPQNIKPRLISDEFTTFYYQNGAVEDFIQVV